MIEIIAEAGLNHQGSLDLAKRLAEAALIAKATAVKYQTYDVDQLLHPTDSSYSTLRDLALSPADTIRLAKYCSEIGIEFLSTPGDTASLRLLVGDCGVKRLKIGSDDLTNTLLMAEAVNTRLPLIVSTGMATISEIYDHIISWEIEDRLTLLHCVSVYPCPFHDANLQAMVTLQNEFDCRVGYSDHCQGTRACLAAAALGAKVIEKHFMRDPWCIDEAVSIFPVDFQEMVTDIRNIEKMMGDGVKRPNTQELFNREKFRKGIDGKRTRTYSS